MSDILELTPDMAIADELTLIRSRWFFECIVCERATEWAGEPEDFEPGHYANVCGRSPRCCP